MNNHEVCIWDAKRFGKPKDIEEALHMAASLKEQLEEAPSKAMLAFAAEAAKLALNLLDEGEELDEFKYMEVEMQRSQRAAFLVLMPYFGWQRVLLMLGKSANKHGLVLVDAETMLAFVPPGKVVPAEAGKALKKTQEIYEGDNALPPTLKQFEAWYEPIIEMALKPHGLNRNLEKVNHREKATYFERHVAIGVQSIELIYQKHDGGYFATFSMSMDCDAVMNIYNGFDFYGPRPVFYVPYNMEIIGDRNPLMKKSDAESVLYASIKKIITLFDAAISIKGLDMIMNGDVDAGFRDYLHNLFYMPCCLIVARLAGNQNFEDLVISLKKARYPGANADAMMTEWPKLVEYLRNEVKPLV